MTWETWVATKRSKRNLLRQARAVKSAKLVQWEEEWMNAKAALADQASDKRHMGTVSQVMRELTQVREHTRRFGHCRHENPAAEAEAWKQHFPKSRRVKERSQIPFGRIFLQYREISHG